MLSDVEKRAVRDSWARVAPMAGRAADLFYRRLAQQNPALLAHGAEQLSAQRREFVETFGRVARDLAWESAQWRCDAPDEQDLFLGLLSIGQRGTHLSRLIEENYSAVGEALLWTFSHTLGKHFDGPARSAWTRLYPLLAIALRLGTLARAGSGRESRDPNAGVAREAAS